MDGNVSRIFYCLQRTKDLKFSLSDLCGLKTIDSIKCMAEKNTNTFVWCFHEHFFQLVL